MSSFLINLLPELQEHIFGYCIVSDLNNVACCNSIHNETIKEMLWKTITIPWKLMSHEDFVISEEKKLTHLKFTRILRFSSYNPVKDVRTAVKEIMIANYIKVLEFCNAELLHTLHISDVLVDEPAIKLTCQLLNKLRTFSYVRVALTTTVFQHITNLHTLTALDLQYTWVDDSHIAIICKSVTKLNSLNVNKTKVTDMGLSLLAEMKSLENLMISSCNISDHGLSDIGTLISLRELDLSYCHVTDNGLSALRNLVLLCKLNLTNCKKVTGKGLSYICSKSLKTLIIDSTGITDSGLHYISNNLLLLETIDVSFTDITDVGLKHLSKLKSLRYLDMINILYVTDDGMKHLRFLTCLRKLDVSYCDSITDLGLFHISNVPSLQVIHIGGTDLTDTGLEHLSKLKGLKELGCYDGNITDAGLCYIGNTLSTIEFLDVSDTKITDSGLVHLTSLRLHTLYIHGTKVTDASVSHLNKMKYLVCLGIDGTKITDNAMSHLYCQTIFGN